VGLLQIRRTFVTRSRDMLFRRSRGPSAFTIEVDGIVDCYGFLANIAK
jgi:hypothetical protein